MSQRREGADDQGHRSLANRVRDQLHQQVGLGARVLRTHHPALVQQLHRELLLYRVPFA